MTRYNLDYFGTRKHLIEVGGIRTVLFQRPGPITIYAAFNSGSRDDPVGQEGLVHYLEHMVVAGTKKFPTKDKMAIFIEKFGGGFGAFTPKEELGIRLSVSESQDLPVAFELLGEMLMHSLYTEQAINNEREAVLGEIGDWDANPKLKMYDLRSALFFQGSAMGRSGVGRADQVKKMTRANLRTYAQRVFVKERLLLVVAGDVKPEAITMELGKLSLPSGKLPVKVATVNKRLQPVIVWEPSVKQIHLTLGFRTVVMGEEEETAALGVIRNILGGGRASTLSRILRVERGLVYSVSADSFQYSDAGYWTVQTTADSSKIQAVIDGITEEFRRVYEGKLTQDELDFVQAKITKSARVNMQTSDDWVDYHFQRLLHVGDFEWDITRHLNQVTKVTLSDLKQVGRKYFKPGTWYLGMIGDIKATDVQVNY
ncbi:insulinase family protein [Candidatus Microgenomates bacterium]|nr:insulinase family protein [Candidatus Microgenomates bacterium]